MDSKNINVEDIIEDKVLRIICKKIYRNASGDIRAMLSVGKEIFEKQLKNILEEHEKGTLEPDLKRHQITLVSAIKTLNQKYEDRTIEVIKSFSLSIQIALFALYYCLTSTVEICSLVKK